MYMDCITEIAKKQEEENIELSEILKTLGYNGDEIEDTVEQTSEKIKNIPILSKEQLNIKRKSNTTLDIVGKTIENIYIVGIVRTEMKSSKNIEVYYKCKCVECGCYFIKTKSALNRQYTHKTNFCPKCNNTFHDGFVKNLIGNRFGKLTVIRSLKSPNSNILWLCKCDCGNYCVKNGRYLRIKSILSCGCYGRKQSVLNGKKLTKKEGDVVNNWKLVKLIQDDYSDRRNRKKVIWEVECTCGCHEKRVLSLSQMRTHVCKKQAKEARLFLKNKKETLEISPVPENIKDLTGKIFSELKVLGFSCIIREKTYWVCECLLCGNKKVIKGDSLLSGATKSCGCVQSFGELEINKFLKKHNIQFETQVWFPDCRDINPLRFDFKIYYPNSDKWFLLEFQGTQHFYPSSFGKDQSQKEKEKNFKDLQKKDKIKRQYCKDNNIELFYLFFYDCDSKRNNIPKKLGEKLGIKLSDDELNESTN